MTSQYRILPYTPNLRPDGTPASEVTHCVKLTGSGEIFYGSEAECQQWIQEFARCCYDVCGSTEHDGNTHYRSIMGRQMTHKG